MKRLEIIVNQSIESDVLEALEKIIPGFYYSRIGGVYGRGRQDPKKGDAVWPEENCILIIYCEEFIAEQMKITITHLKKKFAHEGIKVFETT